MPEPPRRSRRARRRVSAATSGTPTSLADALFTTTQQRLLALLFGQPSRSFFATELIGLTGSGSGAVMHVFVDVMMDHPHEDWGRPFYPVVQ